MAGAKLEKLTHCRACGSENLQKLHGELTATFPSIQGIKVAPIYFSQELVVCLDCGLAEVQVPAKELELFKKGKGALHS